MNIINRQKTVMGIIFLLGLLYMPPLMPMARPRMAPCVRFAGKTLVSAGIISLSALPFFATTNMHEPFSAMTVLNIVGFSLLGGIGNTLFFSWLNRRAQTKTTTMPTRVSTSTEPQGHQQLSTQMTDLIRRLEQLEQARAPQPKHPQGPSSHQHDDSSGEEDDGDKRFVTEQGFAEGLRRHTEQVRALINQQIAQAKRAIDDRITECRDVILQINRSLPPEQRVTGLGRFETM